MNVPLHWTTALGVSADSGPSGDSAAIGVSGFDPGVPNRGGRSGLVGMRTYRLTETTPTA